MWSQTRKVVLLVECGTADAKEQGIKIKVFNTINFKKSMHYNPFAYIHSEKDILKLVNDPDYQHQGRRKRRR